MLFLNIRRVNKGVKQMNILKDKYNIDVSKVTHRMVIKCPHCGDHRAKKVGAQTMQLYNDKDGIRFKCFNNNCKYSEFTFIPNAETDIEREGEEAEAPTFTFIPKDIKLPIGENVITYKYTNMNGDILFYICRTENKIFFPLAYDGTSWYRNKPKLKALYGIEDLNKSDKVIIVEGEKARDYGKKLFPNSAVITWASGSKAVAMGDWDLIQNKTIMIVPDNDDAGLEVVSKLIELLPNSNIIKVADVSNFPDKGDLADIYEMGNEGKILLQEAFGNSTDHTKANTVVEGQALYDDILEDITSIKEGFKFGWDNMDKLLRYPESGLVVIQGRTNHGKSAFMINSCAKLVDEQEDITCVYVSYEMPKSQIGLRFIKVFNDVIFNPDCGYKDNKMFINKIKEGDLKGLDKFKKYVDNNKLIITDSNISVSSILTCLDQLAKQNKRVILFLDYLQLVPIESKKEQRYFELKNMVELIRQKVNQHKFVLVGGSQLTNGDNPYADQSRESKDITFTAELVLKIWNKQAALSTGTYKETKEGIKEYYDTTQGSFIVDVVKSRQSATGLHFGFDLEGGSIMREVKQLEEKTEF
jgi:5S rRNA maturation endonuclease (ribonuclease M5)